VLKTNNGGPSAGGYNMGIPNIYYAATDKWSGTTLQGGFYFFIEYKRPADNGPDASFKRLLNLIGSDAPAGMTDNCKIARLACIVAPNGAVLALDYRVYTTTATPANLYTRVTWNYNARLAALDNPGTLPGDIDGSGYIVRKSNDQ
jgi:hypothetical protein